MLPVLRDRRQPFICPRQTGQDTISRGDRHPALGLGFIGAPCPAQRESRRVLVTRQHTDAICKLQSCVGCKSRLHPN